VHTFEHEELQGIFGRTEQAVSHDPAVRHLAAMLNVSCATHACHARTTLGQHLTFHFAAVSCSHVCERRLAAGLSRQRDLRHNRSVETEPAVRASAVRDSLAFLGMVMVMGRNPATVVTFFVKGWSLAYRNVCEPRFVECASGNPGIRFDNVAP
jgi:hypothetical protein